MRLPVVVLLVVLAACSGGSSKEHAASAPTTTSTTRALCHARTPEAADGTPASVVGTIGDVQIAIVDHGASVDVVSLFKGCELAPVTLDGSPAALPIGGTVTHGDGMRCAGSRITVLSATSDDGATYQATATTYELRGTTLVLRRKTASTIEARRAADTLRSYYELDC